MAKRCGVCGQGRVSCPTPFACETSESVESEDHRNLLVVFVVMWLSVICFGVIVCL
jgi:hypothetical protein